MKMNKNMYAFLVKEFENTSLLEQTKMLAETESCALRIKSSNMLHGLARSMVADAGGSAEKLVRECKKLLDDNPKYGLTPKTMAERMARIALLPRAHLINNEGRVYFAAIDDPQGDQEVWCALDMSETLRKTLEAAKKERAV